MVDYTCDRQRGLVRLGRDAVLMRAAIPNHALDLRSEIESVAEISPFRNMQTSFGKMSVAMTNSGSVGWTADADGYRYTRIDPLTSKPWPTMSENLRSLAEHLSEAAGFKLFTPNVCLINRYERGAKLGLHVDKDELDAEHPIVSISIGASAVFQWGGNRRKDKVETYIINDGDVLVWGGADRLRYHGISKIVSSGTDENCGMRLNLTFRYVDIAAFT